MLKGAAVMAALILAGTASAQVSGGSFLSGNLDLQPQLESQPLFSESVSGSDDDQNSASVLQAGSGNMVQIQQTGSEIGALSMVAQYGADNTADISQCACDNLVDIIQNGDSNTSQINQTGGGNVFVHRQYGDGLSLSVTQFGNAQIAITQTGP